MQARVKFGMLILFLAMCVAFVSVPAARGLFDHQALTDAIAELGVWAYFAFVVLYGLAVTATVPGTVVTIVGASLFSLGEAFVLTIGGAMFGASLSFAIGRSLGRGWVSQWLNESTFDWISKLVANFERRGVASVVYLRIAYVPFPVLNYAAPLTGIDFRSYFVGTLIGILPGTFVFVFMGNTLSLAWKQGDISGLWVWQSPVAIALFLVSLALPKLLKQFENRSQDDQNS